MTALSPGEIERYARQTILPKLGVAGQQKLKSSRVLVVGAGGLGSPASLYLAAAGVGCIGIVDFDTVDESNLQRQILHGDADIGRGKVLSARDSLRAVNRHVDIVIHETRLDSENASGILRNYDIALGCLDNFAARYVLDAACVAQGKPHVYGSIYQFEGQAGLFVQPGPCYRCFFREPPPEDWRPGLEENGVLGSVAGVIGCIQATETVKWLAGIGDGLRGRLLLFDAFIMRFREIAVRRNPDCPVCGNGK